MKNLLLILLTFLLPLPAIARIWTNTDGKQIEADLVSVDDSAEPMRVILRRSDGRTFTLLITILSKDDQDYLLRLVTADRKPNLSVSLVPAGVRLAWTEADGELWQLQIADSLEGAWSTLEISPIADGNRRAVQIPRTVPSRFFRLVRL